MKSCWSPRTSPQAAGLDWARERGLADLGARQQRRSSKEAFDRALSAALDEHRVGTIALAGFMRILSPWFVDDGAGGSSTSTLPCCPNIAASTRTRGRSRRATKLGGCSVHVVTEELDAGEVLGQAEVPIVPGDTAETLEQRVLAAEHRLYPRF